VLDVVSARDYAASLHNQGVSPNEAVADAELYFLLGGSPAVNGLLVSMVEAPTLAAYLASIPFLAVQDLASTLAHNRSFYNLEHISGELRQAGYDWGAGFYYDPNDGVIYHRVGGRYQVFVQRSPGWKGWGDWWEGSGYYYEWDPTNKLVKTRKFRPPPPTYMSVENF
jgi:hypothetical protein